MDTFNPETHSGSWRQLTARHATATDQLMLIVGVHPQQMNEEELEKLKSSLREFFTSGDGKSINITSLYFQIIRKKYASLYDKSLFIYRIEFQLFSFHLDLAYHRLRRNSFLIQLLINMTICNRISVLYKN